MTEEQETADDLNAVAAEVLARLADPNARRMRDPAPACAVFQLVKRILHALEYVL